MKWSFVKLVDSDRRFRKPIDYHWVLELSDSGQLMEYVISTHTPMMVEAFNDASKSKEYHNLAHPKGPSKGEHGRNWVGSAAVHLLHARGGNLVQTISDISSKTVTGMMDCLKEGTIYVQSCGSYMPKRKSHKVSGRVKSDNLIFPEQDKVRFLQWAGGNHWYAKIGHTDIRVDGIMKWESKTEAKSAADKFLGR